MLFVFVFVLGAVTIDGAKEGESCAYNDRSGVCVKITECSAIIEDPVIREFAPACQRNDLIDVVCCNATISEKRLCDPIPGSMTATKTGRKAWDKCIEYQQLVYPCVEGVRKRQCTHESTHNLLPGANNAELYEFPHSVLLGFTNEDNKLDWLCAGTLISDRFVLTVGHCLANRDRGPVSHVAVNPTDRSDISPSAIFKVKTAIKHPEFRPPRHYHNIGLLELEKPVRLSSTTVPACLLLDSEPSEDVSTVTATSWNTHDLLGSEVTVLRKIRLSQYSSEECLRLYPESRRGGYNHSMQLCYGDKRAYRDFCQDDGGSALLVDNRKLSCMYSVVGIASYGRGCFLNGPGVYTRVVPYLSWIESLVWP